MVALPGSVGVLLIPRPVAGRATPACATLGERAGLATGRACCPVLGPLDGRDAFSDAGEKVQREQADGGGCTGRRQSSVGA